MIFTTSDYNRIIRKIEETGFLGNTDPLPMALDTEIVAAQLQGSFPVKRNVAIVIGVIWCGLSFIDFRGFFKADIKGSPFDIGTQLALGFMLLLCILTLTVEPFRELILKEGRTLKDIKVFVLFLMFICAFMLIVTSLIP